MDQNKIVEGLEEFLKPGQIVKPEQPINPPGGHVYYPMYGVKPKEEVM